MARKLISMLIQVIVSIPFITALNPPLFCPLIDSNPLNDSKDKKWAKAQSFSRKLSKSNENSTVEIFDRR